MSGGNHGKRGYVPRVCEHAQSATSRASSLLSVHFKWASLHALNLRTSPANLGTQRSLWLGDTMECSTLVTHTLIVVSGLRKREIWLTSPESCSVASTHLWNLQLWDAQSVRLPHRSRYTVDSKGFTSSNILSLIARISGLDCVYLEA